MTEKTIDPIFAPSVLEHAMAMFDDVNFDALKAEPRLEGVVDKNPKTAAIILAGGSGERFGHEGGKQLVEIAGKPILTRSAEVFDAVGDVGHPSIDTLKVVENGVVVGTPDRSVFWNAQTPQVFRAGIYRRAHASALSDGFVGTDDSSLIERLGGRVLMVEGKRDNIKLTVPEDYLIISAAIRAAIEDRREEQL